VRESGVATEGRRGQRKSKKRALLNSEEKGAARTAARGCLASRRGRPAFSSPSPPASARWAWVSPRPSRRSLQQARARSRRRARRRARGAAPAPTRAPLLPRTILRPRRLAASPPRAAGATARVPCTLRRRVRRGFRRERRCGCRCLGAFTLSNGPLSTRWAPPPSLFCGGKMKNET
jgi:hypothetical protein